MVMQVEMTVPVPRGCDMAEALDWCADVFEEFGERGWVVRESFVLKLGTTWTQGELLFIAERADVTSFDVPGGVIATPHPLAAEEIVKIKERFERATNGRPVLLRDSFPEDE